MPQRNQRRQQVSKLKHPRRSRRNRRPPRRPQRNRKRRVRLLAPTSPILKRGIQPARPPCPDPPLAASPPADSVPTRSLSPAESLIERAREAAFEFSKKLPNFICEEFMSRFTQRGREEEMPLDVVSAEIINRDALESHRNVKINDHPTDKSLEEINGSWSTGEFASTLLELFDPRTDALFRSRGASPISGSSAQLYDFQVQSENSHWTVQADSQTLAPAYGGSVWVDPKSARVLRIEMQAQFRDLATRSKTSVAPGKARLAAIFSRKAGTRERIVRAIGSASGLLFILFRHFDRISWHQ